MKSAICDNCYDEYKEKTVAVYHCTKCGKDLCEDHADKHDCLQETWEELKEKIYERIKYER